MKLKAFYVRRTFLIALAVIGSVFPILSTHAQQTLLNVSYDPTRELYDEYNKLFIAHWKAKKGETVAINQSHGGSGKQARSVIDGLEADVVTLALASDIDQISSIANLIDPKWQSRLPNNSAPYTSTIVFLVKKGNPKGIKDWPDLIKAGVEVITPNPKTSGGARWNYLAAWEDAKRRANGSEQAATDFLKKLFKNVPVLDTGARGSMTTFAERGIGDVLLAWENEAQLATHQGGAAFEIVYPPLSILAEPTVSIVDKVVDKKKTRAVAEEYLKFLYSDEAQKVVAKNFYRPVKAEILAANRKNFPELKLVTVAEVGGSWSAIQAKHFADGGIFDQVSLAASQ